MAKHARSLFADAHLQHVLLITLVALCAIAAAVAVMLLTLRRPQPPQELSSAGSAVSAPSMTTAGTTTENTTLPPTTTTTKPVYVFKELTFSSPTSTRFTTTETRVAIMGSTDPLCPLTMNGKPVELSDIGGFAVDVTLQPGKNTFTFVSNGKTVTYTITHKVDVLRSVSPDKAQTLSGSGSVQFRAVACKGATVKAKFNGQTKTMTVISQQADEESFADSSDYQTYQATFTLPAGTVGQSKKLGAATITATLNGLSESLKTGTVTLSPRASTHFVIVTRDYAETFSGSTVNDFSRPTSAYLPAGTIDQVIKSGSAAGNTYYLLGCGRWVYTEDVADLPSMSKLSANTLSDPTVTVQTASTDMAIAASWPIPYDLQLRPQSYAAPNAATPDYSITKQTTEYIDITFSYSSKAPTAPDVSDSPLFSSAVWRSENEQQVLRLHLKRKGQFYGYSVLWDGNTLRFSFKHPHGTGGNSAEKPLKGVRIVIDPGHGGSSSGTYGTIKGLYEKTVALDYSLILRDKLQALGAEIIMTRTTDVLPDDPTMATRTAMARNNHTDLLLSIHLNGSTASSASGCTLHYFNEYSYAIATRLTDAMRAVEKQHGIGNRSQVCTWSPFFMARLHDCPSVLIECGFMTNAANMSKLVDADYKEQMTDAIVRAVTEYFRSLPKYTITPPATDTTTSTSTAPDSTTDTDATAPESTTATEADDPTTGSSAASSTASTQPTLLSQSSEKAPFKKRTENS